jgi:hypothetical protein
LTKSSRLTSPRFTSTSISVEFRLAFLAIASP